MFGDFEILFIVGLFDFELTYAILTHVKSHFWTVFHLNSFLLFSPRTPPALGFAASARTFFLTFYGVNLVLTNSLKVIALWIMDQVPLGHKSPRRGMARLIHCPACRGLLTSPLPLSSSHVLLECMAVEGTQPGVLCPVIYRFIQELE